MRRKLSISIFLYLLIWQMMTYFQVLPSFILPSPNDVLNSFIHERNLILNALCTTLMETLIGLFVGVFLGSLLAITMRLFKSVQMFFMPLIIISQALPTFAVAPIIVIVFGYGLLSKIVLVALMIFFPVTSAFYDGLIKKDEQVDLLIRTVKPSKWKRFCFIECPNAISNWIIGVKLAIIYAPMGAVIGEWVGANKGLGYLMLLSNARMNSELMFASLITFVFFALILYFSLSKGMQYVFKKYI